jgi:hypothetical protein
MIGMLTFDNITTAKYGKPENQHKVVFWSHIIYRKASTLLVHLNQRSMGTIAITWRPSSVVCKLFTFQASSPKPLGQEGI